jgi:Spy/CpxP family protein refolding chaperone
VSRQARTFAAMLVATVLAAGLAGWLGVQYGVRQTRPPDLDTLLHNELALSQDQDRQLDGLEKSFAEQRRLYGGEMHAANRDLAEAITHDHSYGPAAQAAIERFHKAMMALQEESVRHVLAMRQVLTPQQAKTFDALVTKNLTGAP